MSVDPSPTPGGRRQGGLVLTPLQHRLVTTALAGLSLFVICVLLFILFRVLTAIATQFSTVLLPLAIAGILAGLLRPVANFIENRTRLGRLGATIALYLLMVLVLAAFLWLILPIVISQSIQFFNSLPEIYESLRKLVATGFPQLLTFLTETFGEDTLANLGEQAKAQLAENARSLALAAASVGHRYFMAVFGLTAATAIIPVYLFFFLKSNPVSRAEIADQLSWVREDIRDDVLFLGRHFVESIGTFFQGQILIGLIMGVLLSTGFSLAGITFGFFIGLAIGLLNIIPYLGTIIGLGTVLPVAYLQPGGGLWLAAIALGIFIVVQLIEGYLLTPRIMGNRTGLHPLTIIIAIFFWGTALDGLLGMILAIPLTAFFVVAWRLLREKYLKVWTGGTGST
ncbi:MAG: AI-2E family transporter [Oceanipulchritudo sp.]